MSAIDAATAVEVINGNGSAGQRLRDAREHMSLSIRDVASALNLMVSHVRGIETDRYAELTNDKQFLHHMHDYATLVNLDANEIVDMYRSQSAAATAQIEARPAKQSKRYDNKWYGVGALAVACVCLGIWSLNQTLPAKSAGNPTKSSDGTAQQGPSTAPLPAGSDRIETAPDIDTTEPASGPSISAKNTASVPISKREETVSRNETSTSTAAKTVARSDQAALETTQKQPGKNAINTATSNTILSNNALRAIGAKPLTKTLVELKTEGITQAKR